MKLIFNDEQRKLLNKIVPNINLDSDLTDDELIEMEDELGDHLTLKCLDDNYEPTREGVVCEDLLEILGNIPLDA